VQAIRRDFIECVAGKLDKDMAMLRTEMHQIVGTTATAVRAELHKEWLTEGVGALHAHLQSEVAAVRTEMRLESQAEGLALRAHLQGETKQVLEKIEQLRQHVSDQVRAGVGSEWLGEVAGKVATIVRTELRAETGSELEALRARAEANMQASVQASMQASVQESLLPACMQQVLEEVKQIQHSVSHTTIAGTNRLVDVEQRLLEKIGEVQAAVDVLPKCLAVQSVGMEANSQIRENILEVRQLLSDLQTVGIAQVFDAVLASKTPVIDEIRKTADVVNGIAASQAFRSDVAQVMDEIQKMAKDVRSDVAAMQVDIKKVEASKILEEISRIKTEIDFTTVFRAIKAARIDVSPLLSEIQKLKVPEVRLGPVITEIQKFHGDIRALTPMVTEIHKVQGDMKTLIHQKHVATDTHNKQVSEEFSKLRVDLDPSRAINKIREVSKSDTTEILNAIKKVSTESDFGQLRSAMQTPDQP
jgi:hypothetical protein